MASEEQNWNSNSCLQTPKLILCPLLWVMSKSFVRLWKICKNSHNKISRANGDMVFCGGVMYCWRKMSLCILEFQHSTWLENTTVSDSAGCPALHVQCLCGGNFTLRAFKRRKESSLKIYGRKHGGSFMEKYFRVSKHSVVGFYPKAQAKAHFKDW